jgi:PEP-CTERM motif
VKTVKLFAALLVCAVSSLAACQAATVGLTWQYNNTTPQTIQDQNGTALSGAGSAADGDGFVLQLGYYSAATAVDPFAGTWTPVFGPGTTNSLFSSAGMGDGKATTGTDDRFFFTGTIDTANASTTVGIPASGQIMSIRYYNAASLDSATFFGAASNSTWIWTSPGIAPAPMSFNINQSGTVFQAASGSPAPMVPQTNIMAVPEPSTWALIGFGAATTTAALTGSRRRKMRRG